MNSGTKIFNRRFTHLSCVAKAQTEKIKGKIKTSDGKAAAFINVGSKGTATDSEGKFEIKNLDPVIYTLVTSFTELESKEQAIEK